MIWSGIVNQTIIGLFQVDEGVKLNNTNYCGFVNKTFFTWHKSQSHNFKVKCVFMPDSNPSHVSKLIYIYNVQAWRDWNIILVDLAEK